MAAPTSYQQGQGLAQIFQGNMAADVYAYQQQLRAQQEAEKRKKFDLAEKELSGRFKSLGEKNIFETRDTDEFRNMIKTRLQDKYAGRFEELYKGDTPLRREFEKDYQDVALWADESAASKKEWQQIWKDAYQDNADKYTDEQRAIIKEGLTTAGAFKVPYDKLIPFENIDIETTFKKLAYEPAAKEAADRFTTDKGWKGLESYGSLMQTKLPEESIESHWSTFVSDPKVQNALFHRYGAEAEAAGMELNEYVKKNTPYYDRLKIDKKKTNYGLVNKEGEGGKTFDPSVMTKIKIGSSEAPYQYTIKGGADKGKTATTKIFTKSKPIDADIYPINFPVTIQTGAGGFDWETGERVANDLVLSGQVAGIVNVPIKNGALNADGSKNVYAIVRDEQGSAVAVPVNQVYNQGKQKHFDMDNIIAGVQQYSQPEIPTASMSEWKSAGWTEDQVNTAVSQGKIKLR